MRTDSPTPEEPVMLALAIVSALASAAICYAIGYAIIAPRDSSLRTKRGITMLVVGALSLVFLPPQLPALGAATASLGDAYGDLALDWPTTLSPGTYIVLWLVTSLVALLSGMRIWNAGRPGWRASSSGAAYDSSAAGRAAALIALADNLDDTLDTLRRTGTDAREVDRIADDIRAAGRRYASSLPEESGAVYRLVASKVAAPIAPGVTRYLLEGAGRGGQIANVAKH